MRVATYTQPSMAPRGSFIALCVLVLTIVLGSSALHTLMTHFAPGLHSGIAVLWLLTYLAGFMGLMFGHGINWVSWLARYRILLVILLLGTTVSVSWSLDAAVSAERVVHLLGCTVLAIYLGFMIPLLTTLRVTAVVLGVIMLACLGAATLMPSLGMENYEGTIVWRGILNSKNALGFWASIAVLLYVTLSASTVSLFMKMVCYLFAAISLFVLVKSESATSLVAMLVAGSLSLYLYIAFRFQLGFIRMVVMAILMGGLVAFALSNIDTAEIVGRSGDLTGRGEVWRQTWKLIMDKPLTGYGYGSIWFPNDATLWIQQSLTDFTWVVYHAHNGFLQVASEIGLPLSCIALLMVAQQLIEIFYCQYERQQVGVLFVLAFVVAYLISNFSEARFLVNRELFWIFFIALPISMLRQINLVSVDAMDEEEEGAYSVGQGGPYGHASAPADKPWLRPIQQKEPARLGAAAAMGAASAQAGYGDNTLDNGTLDPTSQLPRLGVHDGTADIDLGLDHDDEENFDLGESDLTESGDHTLDTTRVESVETDDTLEYSAEINSDDVRGVATNATEQHNPYKDNDTNASHYSTSDLDEVLMEEQNVIRPYEEFDHNESNVDADIDRSLTDFNVDDTDVDTDRYDKNFDDDDDDEDWVDISLGD